MKSYWNLTNKERANLTDDEVRRFCDIELMERGIVRPVEVPLLVDPLKEPLGTEEWWVVGSIAFRDQETAHSFLKLQPHKEEYDYSVGYEHKYVEPITETPQRKQFRSRQEILVRKQELAEYKANKEAHEMAMKEYNTACTAVEATLEYILTDYRESIAKMRNMDRIHDVWCDYVDRCEGNEKIARNFLEKAFTAEQIIEAEEWFGVKFGGGTDGN